MKIEIGPDHRKKTFLCAAFIILLLAPDSSAFAQSRAGASLSIACPSIVQAKGQRIAFTCTVENRTSQDLFLLTTPLVLEGPRPPETRYLYLFTGGARTENVLQYQRGAGAKLDLPILLKPVVHLRIGDFSRLAKLAPRKSRMALVHWQLNDAGLPDHGDWSARIKLVFLAGTSLKRLLKGDTLAPVCLNALTRGTSNVEAHTPLALPVISPNEPRGFSFDGCRDVVSEATAYSYSNKIVFRLGSIGE